MLRAFTLSGAIMLLCASLCAQPDTLNKLNEKGKKHGYWTVLLDEFANPVDSLADALFIGIELWDNGVDVFDYSVHSSEHDSVLYEGIELIKGNPVLLEGSFKWYDKMGRLISEESYAAGRPRLIRSFFVGEGLGEGQHPFEVLYFDRLYQNTPGTYYYEEYSPNGKPHERSWFRKGKKGWRLYPAEK